MVSIRRSPWAPARIRGEPTGRAVFIDTGSDCCTHGERVEGKRERGRDGVPYDTTRGEESAASEGSTLG